MADPRSFIDTLLSNGQDPTSYNLDTVVYTLTQTKKALIGFGASWSLISMMLAGYFYLTSFGDTAKAEQAKKRIAAIVLGMALIILSEVIVYEVTRFVNVDSSKTGLTPDLINPSTDPLTNPIIKQ